MQLAAERCVPPVLRACARAGSDVLQLIVLACTDGQGLRQSDRSWCHALYERPSWDE